MKFDHEEFHGEIVTGVFCRPSVTIIQTGQLRFDEIKILFGETSILLSANFDTDETVIEKSDSNVSGMENGKDIACLKDMLGRKLGWIWDCRNSQGYWDMLIFSFSGLEPQVVFLVEASSFYLYRLDPVIDPEFMPKS